MITLKYLNECHHGHVIERPSKKSKVRVMVNTRKYKTCDNCGAEDCSRMIRTENGWDGPLKNECVECYLIKKGKEQEEKDFREAEKIARRKDIFRKMKISIQSKADFAFNEDLVSEADHLKLINITLTLDEILKGV